jgi:hypothetical protein
MKGLLLVWGWARIRPNPGLERWVTIAMRVNDPTLGSGLVIRVALV